MIEPAEHRADRMHLVARRQCGAVDHDDGQVETARGDQLGLRARAAGILADDRLDRVGLQEAGVAVRIERPAIDDERMVRQRWRGARHVDEAQEIMVPGPRGKGRDVHPAEREHHPPRGPGKRGDRGLDVSDSVPAIAGGRHPRWAGERDERHARAARGGDRVRAHRRRERVGRIDQMGDDLRPHMTFEPFDTAEAADTDRHRLRLGVRNAAGVAQRRPLAAPGERPGQRAGFGGAAEDQDVAHG